MNKKIRFFLVTGSEHGEDEYLALSEFVGKVNEHFERVYRISVELLAMEELDAPAWQQEKYQQQIRESEAVFFLLFMNMEDAVRRGFDAAWEQFQSSGKPAIYTYFFDTADEERGQSVRDFMDHLGNQLGHYYSRYDHIDTIKLRLLELLSLQETAPAEMTFRDGHLVVDGKNMMSLENVRMFADNDQLRKWKTELAQAEQLYFPMKAKYRERQDDAEFCRKYAEIASRRQYILETIEETEQNLFQLSLRLVKDASHGELSQRQKEAYQLFEQGDSEGANAILDAEEMKQDYRRRREMLREQARQLSRTYIRELRMKIDILETMTGYSERFADMQSAYEEIMNAALCDGVEYDEIRRYAEFLSEQGNRKHALEIAQKLEPIYEQEDVSEGERAALWETLGSITSCLAGMQEDAEVYYLRAIEIQQQRADALPLLYTPKLVTCYNNIALHYQTQGKYRNAEEYFMLAIDIIRKFAVSNPESFLPIMGRTFRNIADFYAEQEQPQKAMQFYQLAIDTQTELNKENPEIYSVHLADSYVRVGVFLTKQCQFEQAEPYLQSAVSVFETMIEKNPKYYLPFLAYAYANLGTALSRQHKHTALGYYLEAISIYEQLTDEEPERCFPELAFSYNNVGIIYEERKNYSLAEQAHLRAIEILEKLCEKNPEQYLSELARNYCNIGTLYRTFQRCEEGLQFILKATEIRVQLAESNPERFLPELAHSYVNAGILYQDLGSSHQSEWYIVRAIHIFQQIAEKNPQRYLPELADCYNNAAVIFRQQGNLQHARISYESAIQLQEELAKYQPAQFLPALAMSYYNYAILLESSAYLEKSLLIAEQYPDHPTCRRIIDILT